MHDHVNMYIMSLPQSSATVVINEKNFSAWLYPLAVVDVIKANSMGRLPNEERQESAVSFHTTLEGMKAPMCVVNNIQLTKAHCFCHWIREKFYNFCARARFSANDVRPSS